MLSGWGILISFWRFFFCIFSAFFFHGTVCLGSFVFPGAFLLFFLGKIGGILLSPYVVAQLACVGPFIHGFSSFPVCLLRILGSTTSRRTCFRLLRRWLFLFLRFLWPFFSSCFGPHDFAFEQDCRPSAPHSSSVGPNFRCCVSCREPHFLFPSLALPLFPALFFQRCFSSVVSCVCFQLCLGCCQLVFFSCRYVEIAAFLCLPSPLFLSPQALAQHFLARWFRAPIIASYVFPAFLYTAKVWTESCNRCICLA